MNEQEFKTQMAKAKTMRQLGDKPDYWAGFERGLRRGYHKEFGTDAEHILWLGQVDDDEARRQRGEGYRDALSQCEDNLAD
jgi:hypothetical protein